MIEWIPVCERYPENNCFVLIYTKKKTFQVTNFFIGFYTKAEGFKSASKNQVTHWAELVTPTGEKNTPVF
jgi:hypothetical protein